ncbi:MAG: methyltransferase domain-containing protein [Deltaproteobacteria bacterium]|nr:methyltransferase domain-containing protein [Candidatus Zymogenaceae bacterium]
MTHQFGVRDILSVYFSLLPERELRAFRSGEDNRPGAPDAHTLADRWTEILTDETDRGLERSFEYYRALFHLGKKPGFALSYNDPASIIYPHVVEVIHTCFSEENRARLLESAGAEDVAALADRMRTDIVIRNAFRAAFEADVRDAGLSGPMFSFLYSLVYLTGFSSGGEVSFVARIFPEIAEWGGHLLDAGGGSGFAGLVLSTRGPVTYVDFSPLRAGRARALAQRIHDDADFLERVLDLIDLESGAFGLSMDRTLVPQLAGSKNGDLACISADLSRPPGNLGPFDGAIITDVLEHTTDPEAVVKNVSSLLRPGAQLLVTVPTDANGIAQRVREEEEGYTFPFLLHIEFFSDMRIEKIAHAAGMTVQKIVPFSFAEMTCAAKVPMEVMAVMKKR